MRIAITACILLLAVGCATYRQVQPADGPHAQLVGLCEITTRIINRQYLMRFRQSIQSGTSEFTCTLSTPGLRLPLWRQRAVLEPECRRFVAEAMEAAHKCVRTTFSVDATSLAFKSYTGSNIDGSFFGLTGTALRDAP